MQLFHWEISPRQRNNYLFIFPFMLFNCIFLLIYRFACFLLSRAAETAASIAKMIFVQSGCHAKSGRVQISFFQHCALPFGNCIIISICFYFYFTGVDYVFYYELPFYIDDYLFTSRRRGRLPVIRHIILFDAEIESEEITWKLVKKQLLSVRYLYSHIFLFRITIYSFTFIL